MSNTRKKERWKSFGNLDKQFANEKIEHESFDDLLSARGRDNASIQFEKSRSTRNKTIEINIESDDLLEVVLEDGLVFYLSSDRVKEMLGVSKSRSLNEIVIHDVFSPPGYASRGLGDFVLKSFRVLDIEGKLAELTVLEIADKLESRLINNGGLYRWSATGSGWGESDQHAADISTNNAVLIFLHGTASNTEGSFKDLWGAAHRPEWQQLEDYYGDEIYAFEHRTITQSPIQNAIELVRRLPKNATVHLVSHSRGGLVGELLCRGELVEGPDGEPFNKADRECFDPDKNISLFSMLKEFSEQGPIYYQPDDTGVSECLADLTRLGNLLIEKKIKVEKFVRVACPVRGTTLASERLDLFLSGILNLVGLVSGLRAHPVYGFIQALTLAVAKERTNPQTLPGLEAMMPGSPLVRMLNSRMTETNAHLAVVKGDIEPSGIFKRLGILLADAFYSGDHDLVVDSESMEGGVPRDKAGVLFLQGKEVNHFSYFQNSQSVNNIVAALVQPQLPSAFTSKKETAELSRSLAVGEQLEDKPIVFLLPGIAGSNLKVNNKRIWADPKQLLQGEFKKLRLGESVKSGRCNKDYYGNLVRYLSNTHRVIPFSYDWRLSILDASKRLADAIDEQLESTRSDSPIRLAGHSMGGLVIRGMIAEYPDVWQKMVQREGSRALMLGTPNLGSYSTVRLLVGDSALPQLLALVDFKHDLNQWLNILSEFPGVLELLPRHGEQDLFDPELWGVIENYLQFEPEDDYSDIFAPMVEWKKPKQKALKKAKNTGEKISSVVLDPKYVSYIAGKADMTPVDAEISQQEIKFFGTSEGDGSVTWDSGIPDGVKCWYLEAEHGDLANFSPGFDGILDILTTGDTTRLDRSRPISRSIHGSERFPIETEKVNHFPAGKDFSRSILGGGKTSYRKHEKHHGRIHVTVSHGNLRFAQAPVAVGHYQGDSIVSAEAMLNRQLDGRLSDRHNLGLYPGNIGSSEVLLQKDHNGKASGAVIVGLGNVGSLSSGKLAESFRDAILNYVLSWTESDYFSDHQIKISSLLIGAGEGGLPVEDALAAMLRGLDEANHQLQHTSATHGKTVLNIEFIELYEETAALAQRIVLRFQQTAQFKHLIKVNPKLKKAEGGRRRITFSDDANWWERIQIKRDASGGLNFTYLTKRARAETNVVAQQRCTVDAFLAEATQSTFSDSRWSRTLFELLVPREFKYHLGDQRNMLLILDDDAAMYPWELLEYQNDRRSQAPAVQAGLIRQLVTHEYDHNPVLCAEKSALIIGDPPSGLVELIGAQNEAKLVNEKLAQADYKTDLMVRAKGLDILSALMSGQFKILHLAGHGVFNEVIDTDSCELCFSVDETENPKLVTGMVLGKNLYLTATEIAQMAITPELVFINCCHLGNTSDQRPALLGNRYRLAANIATQLIRSGVKAVIAAGWEVSDDPAALFASSFYASMLDGQTFGKAVLLARQATRKQYPASNTWGAYQCYGDPNYRLNATGSQRSAEHQTIEFVCKEEVLIELENLYADAKTADTENVKRLVKYLDEVKNNITADWKQDASVQAALGKVYGELDQFEQAIRAYQTAAASEQVDISIKAMEQLCNFEVRHAATLYRKNKEAANKLIEGAIQRLDLIAQLSHSGVTEFEDTIERWCLKGSAYKRSAMLTKKISDLTNMRDCYQTADQLALLRTGMVNAYPRLNWLAARLVLAIRSSNKIFSDLTDFEEKAREVVMLTESQKEESESFWNDITRIETRIVECLLNRDLEDHKNEIIDDFREQKKKAVSPRQLRSVIENMDFLITMLSGKGGSKLTMALLEIREKLT